MIEDKHVADDNKPHIDAATGMTTTGHEWDGIRELNNPLPRWWLWLAARRVRQKADCLVWIVGDS